MKRISILAIVTVAMLGFASTTYAAKKVKATGVFPSTPPHAARQGKYVFPKDWLNNNRGGRGFEQRVVSSGKDFIGHMSLRPPNFPVSP